MSLYFEHLRYSSGKESTLSVLSQIMEMKWRKFMCYLLEDENRFKKVYGETRIPGNITYELMLRTHGGHHEHYLEKFPDFHIGMLEFKNVVNFTDILFHIGNDNDDTDACILPGMKANNNQVYDGLVSSSAEAYIRVYKTIAPALAKGEKVFWSIIDFDNSAPVDIG